MTSIQQLPTSKKIVVDKVPVSRKKSIKRKADILDDDDDIYDGIKRLYNEDGNEVRMSCGTELHQDYDKYLQMTTVSAN